jgi:hypothetical protein
VKPLRVSTSTLLVWVLLAAVDLAVLRSLLASDDWAWFRIVALPAANLLVLASHRDRRPGRPGEMLAVGALLVAVDLAVLGSVPGNSDQVWLRVLALPMVNVLILADHRDRRLGERRPFLLGFQIAGWVALLAYLALCEAFPGELGTALALTFERVRARTMDNLDFETMQRLDPSSALTWKVATLAMASAASAALTLVMILVATCGGLLARARRCPGCRNNG